MSVIKNKDKSRSKNFSSEEVNRLISLVEKYKNVVENKETDSETWKLKDDCWHTIQKEFNANVTSDFRSVRTLKDKYNGLKKYARKEYAQERKELFKTGGGEKNVVQISDISKRIKKIISISIIGNASEFDNDQDFSTSYERDAPDSVYVLSDTAHHAYNDQFLYSPLMQSDVQDNLDLADLNHLINSNEGPVDITVPVIDGGSNVSFNWCPASLKVPLVPPTSTITLPKTGESYLNAPFVNWSPASLKTPCNPALIPPTNPSTPYIKRIKKMVTNNRQKMIKNSTSQSQTSSSTLEMLDNKKELIELQKKYFQQLIEFSQEEHNLKIQFLREEHELKMKNLQKEMNQIFIKINIIKFLI